jgi:hypothetical protein
MPPRASGEGMIVYRATVEGVTSVDVSMKVVPAADGEDPISLSQVKSNQGAP